MVDAPGWAIVAIPSQEDYIWNISSEKIPHMTLLFLGKQVQTAENVQHIVEYLQHVADTSISRFGLSVDRRGTLGADNADVLFFEENYMTKNLLDARSYLLKDETIFGMYNSTEQHDGWTPHLTLGYPETPAKKDARDYPGTTWVNFDRIALWTGNYDGPTIDLKSEFDSPAVNVAMSDGDLDRVLEHYGIKGMHWGVRRAVGRDGRVEVATATQPAPGKRLKAEGGVGQPAHPDAVRAAIARQTAKKSTTDSLSTKDLQDLVQRMNLEQQYARLSSQSKQKGALGRGHVLIKDILKAGKTYNEVVAFQNSPAGKAIRKSLTR